MCFLVKFLTKSHKHKAVFFTLQHFECDFFFHRNHMALHPFVIQLPNLDMLQSKTCLHHLYESNFHVQNFLKVEKITIICLTKMSIYNSFCPVYWVKFCLKIIFIVLFCLQRWLDMKLKHSCHWIFRLVISKCKIFIIKYTIKKSSLYQELSNNGVRFFMLISDKC